MIINTGCKFVTITPYGKDLEPNVPEKKDVIIVLKNYQNI